MGTKVSPLLVIPDCHHPHVDKRAWPLMLKVARDIQPTCTITMGDFLDLETVSSHDKSPDGERDLQVEIDAGNAALDQLDQLGGERHFIEGNHEHRLPRFLAKHAPQLASMLAVDRLLHLKKRGWRHYPYGGVAKIGKVHFTHDTDYAGANAHERSRVAVGGSTVIAHTHRAAITYSGTLAGKRHVAAMFGWLGDQAMAEYMKGVQKQHWQLAFGLGYVERDTKIVHLQCIPIVDYRCVVNGRLYQ